MTEFNVYTGLVGEDLKFEGIFEFETEEEANNFAYKLACTNYNNDPIRTIDDIIFEDKVDIIDATIIYENEREDEIDYYAEDINEILSESNDDDSDLGFWYEEEE